VMDCAKFGNFGLSRFGFTVRTDRHTYIQTDRQTDRHTQRQNHRITDEDDHYTDVTTVGDSNNPTTSSKRSAADTVTNKQKRK